MSKSILASEIDKFNKFNKADIQLRVCLKCQHFNKSVYKCKMKECIKNERNNSNKQNK